MAEKNTSFIYKIFKKTAVDIPIEYKKELHTARLNINLKRDKTLSLLLIAISAFLLYGDFSSVSTEVDTAIISIHILMLLTPILFLLIINLKGKLHFINELFCKVLHAVLNTVVLTLCSATSVISEVYWEKPFSYVVAIFSIASMVLLTWNESILIYFFSYFIYIAGALLFHLNEENVFSNNAYLLILVLSAFFITRNNYSAFVKSFINDKVIKNKNLELDRLNQITEIALKKRTEELNQAVEYEKLRTNFFANISHELRTPLTLIFSAQQMLELIVKNSKPEDKREDIEKYTNIIRQNCYRLIRLISNLIDVTKLDAGYIKPYLGNYDIVKTVKEITMSIAKYIETMDLFLAFASGLEEAIIAIDPEMVERIILNLLSNAVKYTPKGGSIRVEVCDNEDRIDITIKDTGIGIPEKMQALVFERFVQVDSTHTKTREGSGIGLSLVKSLVDLHNGSIILKSREGQGTEFIISLPKTKVLLNETTQANNYKDEKRNMEKINIEFSDIYT